MSSYLKTPKLFSPYNLIDETSYIVSEIEFNLPKLNRFDEQKIFGNKRLLSKKMNINGAVFNDLFRHAEKCRVQNQVQEKMLKEYLNGNKGIEKKLQRNLTKIEKTRQVLEEELYYMEKEMRQLGLHKPEQESETRQSRDMMDDEILKSYREKKNYWSRQSLPTNLPSNNSRRTSIPKRKGNSLMLPHDLAIKFSQRLDKFLRETSNLRKKNSQSIDYLSSSLNTTIQNNDSNSNDESLTSRSTKVHQLPSVFQVYQEKNRSFSLQRKVSFTKIDTDELDIPKQYKHSSDALEKYKFNPNYYLPDGSLKRKFSLPLLKDSLEAVKGCSYLRNRETSSCDLTTEEHVAYLETDNGNNESKTNESIQLVVNNSSIDSKYTLS